MQALYEQSLGQGLGVWDFWERENSASLGTQILHIPKKSLLHNWPLEHSA